MTFITQVREGTRQIETKLTSLRLATGEVDEVGEVIAVHGIEFYNNDTVFVRPSW